MICPVCGKINPDNDSVCLFCGARIGGGKNASKNPSVTSEESASGRVFSVEDTGENEWLALRANTVARYLARPSLRHGASAHRPATTHVKSRERDDISTPAEESRHRNAPRPVPRPGAPEGAPCAAHTVVNEDPFLTIPPVQSPTVRDSRPPQASPPLSVEEDMLRAELAGSYEIERKLGSGGMATVYLARETALDRLVAVKLLSSSFANNEMFVERFKREARIAASLDHPGIVRIYSISNGGGNGGGNGHCYFVMNYVSGGSVTELLKDGRPVNADALTDIVRDVLFALAYAHSRGVIHRDLKPDNIMIGVDGHAVLTDFGIAHSASGTVLTQIGQVLGTPQYMSPEQALGRGTDTRSDIYSLGVVLYHMASGHLPFNAEDPVSLMYQHVHEHPAPVEPKRGGPPSWLCRVIMRCMEKNPVDRYGSVDDILREFDRNPSREP